jgi:hypothetical protein
LIMRIIVRGTDRKAPLYVVFSTPLLPHPSKAQIHNTISDALLERNCQLYTARCLPVRLSARTTLWSTEQLTFSQILKNSFAFHGNQIFISGFSSSRQLNPLYIVIPNLFKT